MPVPAPPWKRTQRTSGKPGPVLPSALGWPGEPPPAGSRGGACKRRPGTESRPRGAKRCSDRACAGTKLRTSETHRDKAAARRDRPPTGTEAQHPSRCRCPGPCIYSLNNNESHLFIPLRKGPGSGHLAGGLSCFFPTRHSRHVCASPVLAGLSVVCPHVGTSVFVWVP